MTERIKCSSGFFQVWIFQRRTRWATRRLGRGSRPGTLTTLPSSLDLSPVRWGITSDAFVKLVKPSSLPSWWKSTLTCAWTNIPMARWTGEQIKHLNFRWTAGQIWNFNSRWTNLKFRFKMERSNFSPTGRCSSRCSTSPSQPGIKWNWWIGIVPIGTPGTKVAPMLELLQELSWGYCRAHGSFKVFSLTF